MGLYAPVAITVACLVDHVDFTAAISKLLRFWMQSHRKPSAAKRNVASRQLFVPRVMASRYRSRRADVIAGAGDTSWHRAEKVGYPPAFLAATLLVAALRRRGL